MLPRRPPVHVELVREREAAAFLRAAQVAEHGRAVDALLQAEVHAGLLPGVEEVVALVLRVVHPEAVLDVLGQRVHLEREVAPAHRVEEVEADRELGAEARVDGLAEQLARVAEDEVDGPAPRPASRRSRAAGCSPRARSRSTRRSSAPRAAGRRPPSSTARPTGRGRRRARRGRAASRRAARPRRKSSPAIIFGAAGSFVSSSQSIALEERALQAVGRPPVHEEAPLVELPGALLLVVDAQARDLVPPLPLLDLPAREVGVHEHVGLADESGARPRPRGRGPARAAVDPPAQDRRCARARGSRRRRGRSSGRTPGRRRGTARTSARSRPRPGRPAARPRRAPAGVPRRTPSAPRPRGRRDSTRRRRTHRRARAQALEALRIAGQPTSQAEAGPDRDRTARLS